MGREEVEERELQGIVTYVPANRRTFPRELSTQAGVGVGFDSAASVTDPDGDDVEIIDIGDPANGTVTTDDSSITYTPNAGFSGTDTFQVTVEDEYGDTATFTVTVDVNGAPVGDDINVATSEDVAIDIDLLAGVTDPDGDDLEITNVTDPSNGTVSVLNGVATYTPASGFTGTDSFEVTIEDGNGGSLTITVTVTVDGAPRIILATNACVAVVTQVSDSGYLSEFWLEAPGTPSFLGITDESPAGTQVVLGTYPAGTELVLSIHVTNTGHVFQSGPGYRNPDGLVHIELTPGTGDVLYTVGFEDLLGGGDLDFNDAVIDIVAVDCGVTAVDDSVETEEDNAIDIDALVNDYTEHGTLAITDVTSPANGTVTELNGVFTYTPAAGFYGTDTFTYTVENGFGGTATATVTVTVNAGGITEGRMTGGGNYQTGSGNNKKVYNWGFELRCATGGGHFNYHDDGVRLHVNNFTFDTLVCSDEPGYDNGKNLDTVTFTGHDNARYGNDNVDVTIEVVITDKGSNGKNDTMTITVRRASDGQILSQLNNVKLKGGNHVAHNSN